MGIITDIVSLLSLKIKEIREQYFFIFEFFIVGYYALFCICGITFLDYDIVTRLIISIVAAFLLHITHTCALCAFSVVLKCCKDSPEVKKDQWAIPIVMNLLLFTVIKFLLYEGILKIGIILLVLIILYQCFVGCVQGYCRKIDLDAT